MVEDKRPEPSSEYVDTKVRSLKGQITKLRNMIETLEISGLQEQITSLCSSVSKLHSSLLTLEQDVAHSRILHNGLYAQWALGSVQDIRAKDCMRFTRESASAALTAVASSDNPRQIADDWYSQCQDYFRTHGGFSVFG